MAAHGLSIFQQQLTICAGVGLILVSVLVVLSKARLSEGVRNPGPLWSHFAFQIPVYVCSTLIAIALFDVRELWIFAHVSSTDFYDASLWLIYGVIAYCLFFLIFDRLFVERTRLYRKEDSRFLCIAISIIQLFVLLAIGLFAHGLPIFGILTGRDLRILRHDATTDFQGPVYLLAAARTLSTMGMAYFGVLRGSGKRHIPLYVLLGISAFGLVWDAEKSPLAEGILILYFAKAWTSKKPLKTGTFVKIAVIAGAVLLAMFFVAMRSATVSEVLTYLSVRLFLGQSSGYYQAYATVEPNLKYVLSWVPFAGLFSQHVPSFNRDLMVTLQGVTETNGQLNSIFLAEAYGVFGIAGLLVSPAIVAFSVTIGLRIFRRAFSGWVGEYFGAASLFVLMDASNLTGGFAGFPFLRNAIVPFGILMLVVGLYALVHGPARRRTVTGYQQRRAGRWLSPEARNQTMLSRVPAGGGMRT